MLRPDLALGNKMFEKWGFHSIALVPRDFECGMAYEDNVAPTDNLGFYPIPPGGFHRVVILLAASNLFAALDKCSRK